MREMPADDAQLQCPRCLTKLSKRRNARAVIDQCDRCAGNFFDEGEMLRVLGKSADPEVWARGNRKLTPSTSDINCPRCQTRMTLHPLAHGEIEVDIDLCPSCSGIWLDGGETESVMQIGARKLGQAAKQKREKAASNPPESGAELIEQYLSIFPKAK